MLRIRAVLMALLTSGILPFCAHAEALDRVNQTETIRCGYVEYAPALIRDLTTGSWRGFDADIIAEATKRLHVTTQYTAATGWATVTQDLNTGKFDMLCSGFWVHPHVGRFALFSKPAFYQPVFAVIRQDETRIQTLTDLNDAHYKMVALEGDNPVLIAQSDFPKAQILTLPNMTDFSQVLVNVADKKADFTIVDAVTLATYEKYNPGKLKILMPDKAVRTYPVSYVFGPKDNVFRDAFNGVLDEMTLDGTLNRILDRYDPEQKYYYRVEIPYKTKP